MRTDETQAELIVDHPTFARGSTMHRIADYAARYSTDRVAMARATAYLEERRFHARREELAAELDRQRSRLAHLYGWIDRNVT